MFFYMTSGTSEFLKTIQMKHDDKPLVMVQNTEQAVLFHETNSPTIFKQPRKFEVITTSGSFPEEGLVVITYYPVSEEGQPLFEYKFKQLPNQLSSQTGFIATRILKPVKGLSYAVLTIWNNEISFTKWQTSKEYSSLLAESAASPSQTILSAPLYHVKYYLVKK